MLARAVLLSLGVLTVATCTSEAADRGAVVTAVDLLVARAASIVARGDVPGLAIAVVHGDDVLLVDGFGVREIGSSMPVGPDTIFPLASVSKSLTSTVIALLVGEGILSWDTPVGAIDPSAQFYDPEIAEVVTLAELMSHRSGLDPNAGTDLELIGYGRDEILSRISLLPPAAAPGQAFLYSNYGFSLAGYAAAEAAGEPWEDLIEDQLFRPLGMAHSSSRFSDFLAARDRVSYHTLIGGHWVKAPEHSTDAASPAGGVSSTARDLAAWMRLLLADGQFDGLSLIDPQALRETQSPVVEQGQNPITGNPSFYGLGWAIDTDSHGRHVGHNGTFSSGIRVLVDLMPEERLGIVVLANAFPSGVPEAIVGDFYDLVFTGKTTGDRAALFNAALAQGNEQFVASVTGILAEPPSPAEAPLPMTSYAGVYFDEYVGEARVSEEQGELVLRLGPEGSSIFRLRHYDRDVFYFAPMADTPALLFAAVFTVGPGRQATDLTLTFIGGTSHNRLHRVGGSNGAN